MLRRRLMLVALVGGLSAEEFEKKLEPKNGNFLTVSNPPTEDLTLVLTNTRDKDLAGAFG